VILELRDLKKHFPIGHHRVVQAVDGVSLGVEQNEVVGLVGESGCGKSTLGRTVVGLYEKTAGEVRYRSQPLPARYGPEAYRRYGRKIHMIFQDPYSSLNPRMTVREIVAEGPMLHGLWKRSEVHGKVGAWLERVGLSPDHMSRYPHEFSGGQRQRIGIARALAVQPSFIVCDEPVSALDVSVQAQVLNLLADLQRERRLSYLFIAHDLAVVRQIAQRVAVMYLGKIVEEGPTEALLRAPRHPYTVALLSAVPEPDPARQRARIVLGGDLPSPSQPPAGCPFHPRCFHPLRSQRCRAEEPALRPVGSTRAACHYAESTPSPEAAAEAVSPAAPGG
jgi:oligopeptide transport system ATP-binding protein